MFFSPIFKSSPHSAPSPNGELIATLLKSSIVIRAFSSLEVIHSIRLPSGLSGDICQFQWSPDSDTVLVASHEQIHIFPAFEHHPKAVILNPVNVKVKNLFIQFGRDGSEVVACSAFGIKFVIFDLNTLKIVEIGNPKFFGPLLAGKGFSFRPQTGHLALLTRTQGKDLISLHHPVTRELQRSWHPDILDAQQLSWTPDGRWLVVCESPAHGHKLLFYTADGHLFKAWMGPRETLAASNDFDIGAGIKALEFSQDGKCIAVGQYSTTCICIVDNGAVTDCARLQGPPVITPSETLYIWQEQITSPRPGCPPSHEFVKATQPISPPSGMNQKTPSLQQGLRGTASNGSDELKSGAGLISIDSTTTFLASKLDDAPSTVWIWDLAAAELRAVLMFHGHVTTISWHPTIHQLLAIGCEGDIYDGVVFVWNPSCEIPWIASFTGQLEGKKSVGKTRWSWVNSHTRSGTLFLSDSKNAMFASLAHSNEETLSWHGCGVTALASQSAPKREESPLELIPAKNDYDFQIGSEDEIDLAELDDTFRFKNITKN